MTSVSVQQFELPLATPLETAAGRIERRNGFLVQLERDGFVGLGEATPLPGWTEPFETCRRALRDGIAALRAENEDAAFDAVDETPAARHALDLALADVEARRDDVPLARRFGATVNAVPVNATVGDVGMEETVQAAASAVADGYECVKVKVGVRSVTEDLDRIEAVREVVGDGVELRADANGGWSHGEVMDAIRGLADAGVSHVEQPLAGSDLDGHAALRGNGVGIALDETLVDTSVRTVLDADAADVLVVKPMVVGGLDRARDAALEACEAGVPPVVTTTIDGTVARAGAVHLAASLPSTPACGLATASFLEADLAPDPHPVSGGVIGAPSDPGIGVDPESIRIRGGSAEWK